MRDPQTLELLEFAEVARSHAYRFANILFLLSQYTYNDKSFDGKVATVHQVRRRLLSRPLDLRSPPTTAAAPTTAFNAPRAHTPLLAPSARTRARIRAELCVSACA